MTTRKRSRGSGSQTGGSTTPTPRSRRESAPTASIANAARCSEPLASPRRSRGTPSSSGAAWRSRAAGSTAPAASSPMRSVSPEHAWLAVREAEVALAAGAPAVAREAAARAVSLGGEVGSEEVQVIGRSLDGLALVYEGSIDEGMRQLDESAVAARAGDVKDMAWVGKVCCNLIAACERVGDVDRASEWCAEVKEFAQRWELQALFNVCRTQYAAVLLQTGAWQEAEAELQTALAVFHGGRRAALFDGTARLGELRRRQGRLDEARALFAASERSSVARLGLVALCLDEEDPETAFAAADRLARSTDPQRPLDRISVLALVVRAGIATERLDAATEAADELDALAAEVGTSRARAAGSTRERRGCCSDRRPRAGLPLVRGCNRPARRSALRACGGAARARRRPARVAARTTRVGRSDRGTRCLRRARRPARCGRRRSAAGRAGRGPAHPTRARGAALVAAGRSNREIASELVLSEHTVHRHVANILRKLDEPTRAAAAARAARDGLI